MKLVRDVEHRTFSGRMRGSAASRCCTSPSAPSSGLCATGIELIEIAPGVDLERDVLAQMEFRPVMNEPPKLMEAAIFRDGKMGLRDRMLAIPLARRFAFAAEQDIFFINFERLAIRRPQDIADVRAEVEKNLAPIGRKVYAIVNYDGFTIVPELVDAWSDLVQYLMQRYYTRVTRYTTSNFLRMKLGDALEERGVAPHIYESAQEALAHLDRPKA